MQYTAHALERMNSRRIGPDVVDFTLGFGEEVHAAGATFYILRRLDIPPALLDHPGVRRAEGTVVVVEHGRIATVYRTRDLRRIRRKPVYGRHPRRR